MTQGRRGDLDGACLGHTWGLHRADIGPTQGMQTADMGHAESTGRGACTRHKGGHTVAHVVYPEPLLVAAAVLTECEDVEPAGGLEGGVVVETAGVVRVVWDA